MNPTILLSFDVEEFDIPLEYGHTISEAEQLKVGYEGFEAIADLITKLNIEVTAFTTANFANHYSNAISVFSNKHEIASHTYYHSSFDIADLKTSRLKLEEVTNKPITGLRMPRMKAVEMHDVAAAGYLYDSSINPTWLPGRYNNLHLPRTVYTDNGMLRLPASVSPRFRFPLFWLSFKNFPYSIYLSMLKAALKKDGYVCIYFHPWEFVNLDAYRLPGYVKKYSGTPLLQRLQRLINDLKPLAKFQSSNQFLLKNS